MEDTARQHYIIGENLRIKGFYDDAIGEFRKSLKIREPLLGCEHFDSGKSNYALGLALRATREYPDALNHLRDALKTFEVAFKDKPSQEGADGKEQIELLLNRCKLNIARTHHSQGVEYQRNGDYDRSIVQHRKAQSIREQILGKSHLETGRTYYVLGCALSDRGDFDEALADLRRALRIRVHAFGKDMHTDIKEVLDNITTVLHARAANRARTTTDKKNVTENGSNGHIGELEINGNGNAGGAAESSSGWEDYRAILLKSVNYELAGDKLCENKEYDLALMEYRKSLALEEQCLGELHPTTCDLYLKAADALGGLGDFEASLREYKSAISIYERLVGKFHVKVASIYDKLGGILMDKGEYETALSFYCKAYGIYDSTLGNHPDTQQALINVRLAAEKEHKALESMKFLKVDDTVEKEESKEEKEETPTEATNSSAGGDDVI